MVQVVGQEGALGGGVGGGGGRVVKRFRSHVIKILQL